MKGTALGNWVAVKFQDRLLTLTEAFYGLSYHDPKHDPGKAVIPKKDILGCYLCPEGHRIDNQETLWCPTCERYFTLGELGTWTVADAEAAGHSLGLDRYQQFYRASNKTPTERHKVPMIDGACGFSSVEKILGAIGCELEWVHGSRSEDIYILYDPERGEG